MSALAYKLGRYSADTLAAMREQRSAIASERITQSMAAARQIAAKHVKHEKHAEPTGREAFPVAQMGEFREVWAALRNTRSKLTALQQESDLRAALESHLMGRMSGDVWRKMLNGLEAKLREREPLAGTSIGRRPGYEPAPPPGW